MSSNEAVNTIEVAKYIEWLNKEGFELETTVPCESDTVCWVRKTKYSGPRCSVNGQVSIVVTKVGDTFGMHVRASTPNYWAGAEVYNLSEDYLVNRGRQIEHRLVDAWRELSA